MTSAFAALTPMGASACAECRPSVRAAIFTADFLPTLAALMLPMALLGLLAAAWTARELWNGGRS